LILHFQLSTTAQSPSAVQPITSLAMARPTRGLKERYQYIVT
jgi:hypothetical protein